MDVSIEIQIFLNAKFKKSVIEVIRQKKSV